jgi:hypothetical protein
MPSSSDGTLLAGLAGGVGALSFVPSKIFATCALSFVVQAASFEATHEQRRSPARLFDADLRVSALVGRVLFARVCPGRSLRDRPGWDLRSPRGPFGSLSK